MKYSVIQPSWAKRRKCDPLPQVLSVELIEFKKIHNHFCKMRVVYCNLSEESLIARVIYDPVKQDWLVDGMKVAIRLE